MRPMSSFYNAARPAWHLIDGKGQVVGRLAVRIAAMLRGKHKPTFNPQEKCGDHVVVVNADKVVFTGKKHTDKIYHWHSGFPGGKKQRSVRDQLDHKPEEVLRKAVVGMLPKNKLAKEQAKMLRVFAGEVHPHSAQATAPTVL